LRFRLREELRPFELELRLLLSLGALVSESLSTRLDSVRAPDLLCVEERLEPEDRLRDELDREDDLPFDLFEEPPPDRLLLLDRDFCLGIPPRFLLNFAYLCCGLTRIRRFKHAW
jgi:hypothetical protein